MLVKVIKTYDQNKFEEDLSAAYKELDIVKVDTHTEVLNVNQKDLIHYIAIVVYKDHVILPDPDEKEEINLDDPFYTLNIPGVVKNAISRYNRGIGAHDGDTPVNTISDFIEFVKSKGLKRLYGVGPKNYNLAMDKLKRLGLIDDVKVVYTLDTPIYKVPGVPPRLRFGYRELGKDHNYDVTIGDVIKSIQDGSIYNWRNIGTYTVQQVADVLHDLGFDINKKNILL